MLIARLKAPEEIRHLAGSKIVALRCKGCDEVCSPGAESSGLLESLSPGGAAPVVLSADIVCNPENVHLFLEKHKDLIGPADALLVLSCGVGVQTVAGMLDGKPVLAACDTYPLPGHQGLAPLEYDCALCGKCHLNDTGGICPITSCAKGLLNGQCGGAKNGMCEVDTDRECGWELIYRRLGAPGASPSASPSASPGASPLASPLASPGASPSPVEIRDFGL